MMSVIEQAAGLAAMFKQPASTSWRGGQYMTAYSPGANATLTQDMHTLDGYFLEAGSRVVFVYDSQGRRWIKWSLGNKSSFKKDANGQDVLFGTYPQWVKLDAPPLEQVTSRLPQGPQGNIFRATLDAGTVQRDEARGLPPVETSAPEQIPQIPVCPAGQVLWAKFKAGQTIQVDGQLYYDLLTNADTRRLVDHFFCVPAEGETNAIAPPRQPSTQHPIPGGGRSYRFRRGGFRGLPEEDKMIVDQETVRMAAGLGALFQGFGALEVGQTVYVTTRDQGRLGSLIIQPNSQDTSKGTAIGYFPKNTAVKVSGPTFGSRTQVTGPAWSLGQEIGKSDEPLGETTGWVASSYLKDTPGGEPWTPGGGGGGGGVIEPASEKTVTETTMDYTPWILGGAAVIGIGVIGWAIFGKPKRGGHRRRARA